MFKCEKCDFESFNAKALRSVADGFTEKEVEDKRV